MAVKAAASPASTNEITTPGPAYCAAAVPVVTKMPAPTTLAIPSVVRLKAPIAAPSRRFRSFLAWTRIVSRRSATARKLDRYARGNHYCVAMEPGEKRDFVTQERAQRLAKQERLIADSGPAYGYDRDHTLGAGTRRVRLAGAASRWPAGSC